MFNFIGSLKFGEKKKNNFYTNWLFPENLMQNIGNISMEINLNAALISWHEHSHLSASYKM